MIRPSSAMRDMRRSGDCSQRRVRRRFSRSAAAPPRATSRPAARPSRPASAHPPHSRPSTAPGRVPRRSASSPLCWLSARCRTARNPAASSTSGSSPPQDCARPGRGLRPAARRAPRKTPLRWTRKSYRTERETQRWRCPVSSKAVLRRLLPQHGRFIRWLCRQQRKHLGSRLVLLRVQGISLDLDVLRKVETG